MLRVSAYEKLREKVKTEGTVCHGEYNQHNVLIMKSKTAVTGFSHWYFGASDWRSLSLYEKNTGKIRMEYESGRRNVKTYHRIRPISREEVGKPKNPIYLSGKILETVELLLYPQQSLDFRKKYGKASFRH